MNKFHQRRYSSLLPSRNATIFVPQRYIESLSRMLCPFYRIASQIHVLDKNKISLPEVTERASTARNTEILKNCIVAVFSLLLHTIH